MAKRPVIFSLVLAALLLVSSVAVAVEFGPDSANITNRYLPAKPGDWQVKLGAGIWTGRVMYLHAVAIETVSGAKIETQTFNNVTSLKVNVLTTDLSGDDDFSIVWFAQDTEGNVWVLKSYLPVTNDTYWLGTHFTSWMMPAVPAVGDPAAITIPETKDDYCRIVATGISVDTNYASYNNCIRVRCYHPSDEDEIEYFCQDFGSVRMFDAGGSTDDVLDLKEYGTAGVTQTRTVVIPLMD